jgi:Fe-S-cluster containining protein
MAIAPTIHPCLKCGACCAFFRVSFHWSETFSESHGVPIAFTQQISPYANAMTGTDQKNPRCIGLEGEVGIATRCRIYSNRPNCCRTFKASYEDGTQNPSCDQARVGKGMLVLTSLDWPSAKSSAPSEHQSTC